MSFVDLPTLYVMTVFATAMSGLLLFYAWLINRHTRALAIWAAAYVVGSLGTALIIARGAIDIFWSVDIANTLLALAYGLSWLGARSFENRTTSLAYVFAGAIIWLIACQIEIFYVSLPARIVLISAIIGCYTLATAFEFWRGREIRLMSRWPLIVILGFHAAVFFSRIFRPGWLLAVFAGRAATTSLVVFVTFDILFHTFCAAFMLALIAKERMELRYRQASLADPLTGILNRRAFIEKATHRLRRLAADGEPAMLVAFDLDRFKAINDSYGHAAGDRVLLDFCRLVEAALRPTDIFARIGGEEFACLLPGVSGDESVSIVERIRKRLAETEIEIGQLRLQTTVSAGMADAADHNWDLMALMQAADRALYLAKSRGRNKVEFAEAEEAGTATAPALGLR